MSKPEEIRALASRVRELRQELESVEASLRELSGDATPDPIEPIDSPTVLTTNHAMRRARGERMMPFLAAAGTVMVLGLGIAIGVGLRSPSPSSPAPVVSTTAPVSTPAPSPAKIEEAPTATVAEAPKPPAPPAPVEPPAPEPPSTATAVAPPSPPLPPATPVTPVATAPRGRKLDRGF